MEFYPGFLSTLYFGDAFLTQGKIIHCNMGNANSLIPNVKIPQDY
jgi:hypothetical protein